jgi:VWFA-related protein
MVISFDRRIRVLTGMTADRRLLESAIRSTSTGSGTSVYDTVYETVARRLQNIDGRKAMILFSDGEDTTSSRADYDSAVNIVTESDVLVYCLRYPSSGGRPSIDPWPRDIPQIPLPIPWPWPRPRRRGGTFTSSNPAPPTAATPQWNRKGDFLEDLATAGGGPVYDAQTIGDLATLASKIADELRHVYVISYYPTNPLSKGGYRSLRVRVTGREDLAVRHRRGYNAK